MGREVGKGKYKCQRDVKTGKKNEDKSERFFLNNLNIGDSDSSGKQVRGFDNVDDMYNWFRPDRSDDWRQRD